MKNTQKGFSTLLGLLLFIVLAGGGLYLYTEKVSKEMPEVNFISTTTQNKNVATTPNEMANWETYTNTKYKFILKYPDDWVVEELGPSGLGFYPDYEVFTTDDAIKLKRKNHHPSAPYPFSIDIASSKKLSKVVDSWLGLLNDPKFNIDNEIVILSVTDGFVSGVPAKKATFNEAVDYYFEKEGTGYLIGGDSYSEKTITEKIISTFEFY